MKAITSAICFFILLPLPGFSQFCLPNGIIFSRQSQLDSFPLSYPGCILIEGDLHIEGDDIVNINGLYPIVAIKGNLLITYNQNLDNLEGLHSLRTIEGSLSIIQNSKLKSLNGLTSLESVKQDFLIHDNDGLIDLSGANKFHIAKGDLLISQNDNLVHPVGLKVDSILATLYLDENAIMQDLNGLDSLTYIGGDLLIQNNASLTDLSGIHSLLYVGDHLELVNNAALENIDAFDHSLNTPWELLIIENCPQLSDCAVMSICNHLAADGNSIITSNASGCNSFDEVLVGCTVDLKDPKDETVIFVYPNPTSGSIEIFGIRHSGYSCKLHTIHGQFIRQWNSTVNSIDLKDNPPGIYILTIEWYDHVINKQVIRY